MTVNTPVGMSTLTFCRLLAFAPLIDNFPVGERKSVLMGTDCFMYLPVNVFALNRFLNEPSGKLVRHHHVMRHPRTRIIEAFLCLDVVAPMFRENGIAVLEIVPQRTSWDCRKCFQ